MARDVQRWPQCDLRTQQRELDRWRQEFNHVRPHEALGGKTPAEVFRRSERKLHAPRPFAYPGTFVVRRVDHAGHISCHAEKIYVGLAFRGQRLGFEPQEGLRWRLWLRDIDLGTVEVLPDWFDQAVSSATTFATENTKRNTNQSSEAAA